MNLTELVQEDRVIVGLAARTKDEAIAELIARLVGTGAVPEASRADVLAAIVARERSHTTGVGQGVALPHGAVESVWELVGALGVSRDGVDFESVDGEPAHLVLLTVVPRNKLQAHVATLPGVARLLNKADLRERIRQADDAGAIMRVLAEEEGVEEGEDFIG